MALDPSQVAPRTWRWISHAPEATEALGESLGRNLRPGDVVALHGELGAGKTCFVRGVARAFGVEDAVASPSFTLMHHYVGRVPIYHLDAWMQARGEAFLQDGGSEWLTAEGVALVEWAERVAAWIPRESFAVHLRHAGPDSRAIEIAWRGAAPRVLEQTTPAGCEEHA